MGGRQAKSVIYFFLLLWGVGILAGCTPKVQAPPKVAHFQVSAKSDLERVWEGAIVALPIRGTTGSMITTNEPGRELINLTGAAYATRWPVILLIVGCQQAIPTTLMKVLAEQGYVVIAPDSHARFINPLNCTMGGEDALNAEKTLQFRQTEIRYSLNRLKRISWVDLENVFLFGLHDGAASVSLHKGRDVKARVLSEWNCQGAEKVRGVSNENKSPLFAVSSSNTLTFAGDCGAFFSTKGESQVFTMPEKYSDNILLEPIVFTQLLRFLDGQLFK
ncbi:MAG: hypothetical protein JKY12_03415 [Sneathiella sp.]|nr:hypothetical protein [Sneathiella sp.]